MAVTIIDLKSLLQRWMQNFGLNLQDRKAKRQVVLWLLLLCFEIFLIFYLFFLSYKIKIIDKSKQSIVNSISPQCYGVEREDLEEFKSRVKTLEQRLLGLVQLFDPVRRQYPQGYEVSLYFVEQLQKAEESLKLKAKNRGLKFLGFGFKDELPSEKEAVFYLKQLDVLEVLIDTGLDHDIDFESINPQEGADQKDEDIDFVRLLIRLEFVITPSHFVEYVSKINEMVPLLNIKSLKAEEVKDKLVVSLLLEQLHSAAEWRNKKLIEPIDKNEIIKGSEDYLSILRGTNPFFQVKSELIETTTLKASSKEGLGKKERFIFRGSAVFREKPVAVIEDTLNKETLFISKGEYIADFQLREFSRDNAILISLEDGEEEVVLQRKR